MRILVLGRDGQVGRALQKVLPQATFLGRAEFDLNRTETIAAILEQHAPDVLINAAAMTEVDRAESAREEAMRINADAVGAMAEAMAKRGGALVQYSTDYVFPGSGTAPWRETDAPAPLNSYGESKLQGERQALAAGCRGAILRTSWLYAAHGRNFPKTILKLARERDELRVVDDQHGAPTPATLVAEVTARILPQLAAAPMDVYHLAAAGETSWFGFAQEVLRQAHARGVALRCPAEKLVAAPTSAYATPAKRPANSRLNTEKLQKTFGLAMPAWTEGMAPCMDEWIRETTP